LREDLAPPGIFFELYQLLPQVALEVVVQLPTPPPSML